MILYQFDHNKVYEYFFNKKLKIDDISFINNEQNIILLVDDKEIVVDKNTIFNLDDKSFLIIDSKYNYYKFNDKIVFGPHGDIINNTSILIEDHVIYNYNKASIYVNYQLTNEEFISFNDGDIIILNQLVFSISETIINIFGDRLLDTKLEYLNSFDNIDIKYQKSPRLFKRFKEDTVEILKPNSSEKLSGKTITKIIVPPLISIVSTLLLAYFTKRGIFAVIGVITTIATLTFSITSFVNEKKMIKANNQKRKDDYNKYLLDMRKELNSLYNNELDVYNYNYPNSKELEQMLLNFSSRIYERDSLDDDFLTISMGYCDQFPNYKLKFNQDVLNKVDDQLINEAKNIYDEYKKIKNTSYTISLLNNHLGLVGDKEFVHEEIKRILIEITTFHSYHDVKIVLLYDEMYSDEFLEFSWLKHLYIDEMNLTLNINDSNTKEMVLSSLYQIIKQRTQLIKENKDESSFTPHFVIYIDDFKLIVNHPIMEYLQSDLNLGFTIIVRVNQYADLISNIKNVFVYDDFYNTKLVILNGDEQLLNLVRDTSLKDVNLSRFCRSLSILDHQLGVSTTIPDSIDFINMQSIVDNKEINSVTDIDILQKWNNNLIYENISVPIGMRSERDVEYLDLHEKKHGPHGLIAGTTGSGKSEVIQTYILSLAINFSPEDVGFLLIDYKGGGMANLFSDLPHLIGTITNLDGADSMRALVSIKAELARRQKIFNKADVNNINSYTKLYKAGEVSDPMPHLFLISDEFAELKKEQPDFMKELITVARIGRTLGVHLILATQKPSGVVNDQIWSNSKFKIALKVQDESDSKEVIKTPDAAYITKTGRAYLQVGNNEIYELFQSAWSGAKYEELNVDEGQIDNRVYLVNNLGQDELINKDLSKLEDKARVITQLDIIVEEINNVYQSNDFVPIPKAWQPPLGNNIINPTLIDYQIIDLSNIKDVDLNLNIGLLDEPNNQVQKNYVVDFRNNYNLAIYGSSGYGKSFALQSFIFDLASKNNPELLSFYVIDLGNGGLINIKHLVHVADYITFDNLDKLNKLMNILNRIIDKRKKLCLDYDVQNIYLYESQQNEVIPKIFIVIDDYQILKEVNEEFLTFVEKISRDGYSLGIYLMFSTTKNSTTKPQLMNNVKNKLTLYQDDNGETLSIVGKTKFPLNSNAKGRALVKTDEVYQLQIYSILESKEALEFNNKIRELITEINDKYTGNIPRCIPELPNDFYSYELNDYDLEDDDKYILGLTLSDVTQLGYEQLPTLLPIVGPTKSGKTNLINIILSQLDLNQDKVCIIDTNKNKFVKYSDDKNVVYSNDKTTFLQLHDKLVNKIEKRQKESLLAFENNECDSVEEYINDAEKIIVVIDDLDYVYRNYLDSIDLTNTIERGRDVGISFIIGVDSTSSKPPAINDSNSVYKMCRSSADYVILGRQTTFTILALADKAVPKFKQGVINRYGELRRILIPEYKLEE